MLFVDEEINLLNSVMMCQLCIVAGREHDFVRCMNLHRFFHEKKKNRMEQNRFGVKVE